AEAAAAAADSAAQHAGEAASAAATAPAAATEAAAAADTAANAATQAHKVADIARDSDAERVAAQQAAEVAAAETAARIEAQKDRTAAWEAGQASKLAADTEKLLGEATAAGVNQKTAVAKGRQVAVRLLTAGGPWTQAVAETALQGTDADVLTFLGSGLAQGRERDDRVSAMTVAQQSTKLEQRLAAETASVGTVAQLRDFLATGAYPGKDDDDRVQLSQIMAAGGPAVKDAAGKALDGGIAAVRAFLAAGQYKAREDDNRILVSQALASGGPEVKAAAQAVLSGPASGLVPFLQTGLPKAQQRDAFTTAHVATVNSYLANIDGSVATARQYAAQAAQSYAIARGAANDAADYANQAKASADKAADWARQAAESARQAKASADQAAAYAKQAQAAAASASAAARSADVSASAAAGSAAQAHQYAADAKTSADAAQASAIAAGKSAAEAAQAAADAQAEVFKKQQAATAEDKLQSETATVDDDGRVSFVEVQPKPGLAQEILKQDVSKCMTDDPGTEWGWLSSSKTWHKNAAGVEVCDVPVTVKVKGEIDYIMRTCPEPNLSVAACQGKYSVWDTSVLTTKPVDTQYETTLELTYEDYAKHYKLYCGEGACATGDSSRLLFHLLTDDFVKCFNHPGLNAPCAWAVTTVVPFGTLAKGAKAVVAFKMAVETGAAISDTLLALKTAGDVTNAVTLARLDALAGSIAKFRATLKSGAGTDEALAAIRNDASVDRAIVDRLENEAEVAANIRESCPINSFPSGTEVLLADGSHKPISEIRRGDQVLATDPATGGVRAEPVTAAFNHTTQRLVDVVLAGDGTLSTTAGHRLYVDGTGWTVASDLRIGDRLRTADGSLQTISGLHDRTDIAPQPVYDLTVDGLHTFYVRTTGGRSTDLLVHNCLNIVADEGDEAHTLEQHVNPTPEQAQAKADGEVNGKATMWNDQATAERSVSDAFQEWIKDPENAQRLTDWKTKQAQRIGKKIGFDPRKDLLPIRWELRGRGPLGKVYTKGNPADGSVSLDTGSWVEIRLKYIGKTKGHPEKWVVYTSYPV
ncbi:polymorphic toxin-type HINT domain-containing protein, partial [Kitasatospora cinereorecta]